MKVKVSKEEFFRAGQLALFAYGNGAITLHSNVPDFIELEGDIVFEQKWVGCKKECYHLENHQCTCKCHGGQGVQSRIVSNDTPKEDKCGTRDCADCYPRNAKPEPIRKLVENDYWENEDKYKLLVRRINLIIDWLDYLVKREQV